MPKKDSVASFEKNLEALEVLVDKLEQGEISLDESLKEFERGVKLARQCQQSLSQAEQRIQQMLNDSDAPIDLDPDEDSNE